MSIHFHFDYGGHYVKSGDGCEWISTEEHMYPLLFKRLSVEEISYSMLLDGVCKKVGINAETTSLKLSFIPLDTKPLRKSYIIDDDDVYVFLTSKDTSKCRSVLHVEVENNQLENALVSRRNELEKCKGLVSRIDEGSSFGVNYELVPIVDGAFTPCELEETIREEQHEAMEDEVSGDCGNKGSGDSDNSMEHEVYEPPMNSEEVNQLENGWEDKIDIQVGREFNNKKEMKDFVEKGARKGNFATFTKKSDTTRYVLRCRLWRQGCKWFFNGVKVRNSSSFRVSVYNNIHTCSRASAAASSESRNRATQGLVASYLKDFYPGVLKTPRAKDLMRMVQSEYGTPPSYSTCWRGKNQTINEVRGDPEEGYKKVYSYLYMLEAVNHGTTTKVKLDELGKFQFLFIALGACIEGFKSMRQVLIIDGTFLKSGYGGVLLIATAQDPNRHTYPVAFAVVDSENDASWLWFFETLKSVIPDSEDLVFVSDRNQSLIKSVLVVYPKSKHGFCIYHLSQNVRQKVSYTNKDVCAAMFREVAQIYSEPEFLRRYADFRNRYPKVALYLDESVHVSKWARCYFPGVRYNIDTTNSVESLNNVLEQARNYNLLPMVDAIVSKTSEWFNRHRKETIGYHKRLVPFVEDVLHERCAQAHYLIVTELNTLKLEYSCIGRDGKTYLVNLLWKSCSCKTFDIDKYPCVHAIAALYTLMRQESRTVNYEIHDLCDQFYKVEHWILAYSRTVYLVPDNCEWNVPPEIDEKYALPPNYKNSRGRRRVRRLPSKGEPQRPPRKKTGGSQSREGTSTDTNGVP